MMKKYSLKTILVIFLIFLFFGCGSKIKGPAIRFNAMSQSFGEVNEGVKVSVNFVFKNIGTETVVINDVHPTCGCTLAGEYDKEVEPGKEGKIPLVFNSKGYQGHVAKTIRVETNVPDNQTQVLTIEGTIRVMVAVEPRSLNLGEVNDKTQTLEGIVTITNNTDRPMEITDIQPPNDNTKVNLSVIEQNKIYKLDIVVSPPYEKGHIREIIKFKSNIAEKPDLEAAYTYFFPPLLDVKPDEIFVNPDIQDNTVTRIIYIYTSIGIPLEIVNINITAGNIDYEVVESNPGELYQIKLDFKPGFVFPEGAPVYISFQIRNAPDAPTFTIPIKDSRKM